MKRYTFLCVLAVACAEPAPHDYGAGICLADETYESAAASKSGTYTAANDCCAAWAFKCEQSPGDDSCLGYADEYYHLAFKCIYAYSESEL